jgi:hypothetical protein
MPSNETIRFMLAHVSEPATAARLADQLASDLSDLSELSEVVPKAYYPPTWVLAKQKSAVALAAHAITYCNDPDTLDVIATSATRQGVRKALLANPILRASTRDQLRSSTRFTKLSRPRPTLEGPALAELNARVSEIVSITKHGYDLSRFSKYLDRSCVPASVIDALFDALLAKGHGWVVLSYLASINGIDPRSSHYQPFWLRGSLSATDVLSRLRAEEQRSVLTNLIDHATAGASRASTQCQMSAELARHIVALADPARVPTIARYSVQPIFTEPAFDTFLADPSWQHVLWYHEMTPAQLRLLVQTVPAPPSLDGVIISGVGCP